MGSKEKKQGKKIATRKRKRRERPEAEVLQLGDHFLMLDVLMSTCGQATTVWQWPKAVPVIGIFINLGICSVDVSIAGPGAGPPAKGTIPSQAGPRNPLPLGHAAANSVTIKCLLSVPGGDCTVLYLLIW